MSDATKDPAAHVVTSTPQEPTSTVTPTSPPAVPTELAPTSPATSMSIPAPQPAFGPQWPGPGRVAPPAVLVAVVVAGLVAAAAMPWDRPGVGWFATAVVVAMAAAATVWAHGAQPDTVRTGVSSELVRLAWGVMTLALIGVGTVRAASWLFVLCVLAACVTGSLALVGGRSLRGLFLGAMSVPLAMIRALPWASRAVAAVRGRTGGTAVRTAAAAAIGLILLLVFGALLAGADAAFAAVLDDVLPTVDAGVVSRWVFSFLAVGLVTLAACFLALAPPAFDGEPATRRRLRRIEWAMPVGALVALFAGFVAVQATVLFGGGEHVLRTAGLTYAEYARRGFWQLLVVTALTLVVLAVAAHVASRETLADRAWLRAMLGSLALLSLVIVASALSRTWAYEQAYGFTRLRVLVSVCEVWLGVVFVLVIGAGVRLDRRASWLPGAVVGTAAAALLGIAVLNPDRFIAEQNVIRFEQTRHIDLDYLSGLSADAVAALDRLAEPMRSCALYDIDRDLDRAASEEEWRHWNLGRHQARQILADYVSPYAVSPPTPCWSLDRLR